MVSRHQVTGFGHPRPRAALITRTVAVPPPHLASRIRTGKSDNLPWPLCFARDCKKDGRPKAKAAVPRKSSYANFPGVLVSRVSLTKSARPAYSSCDGYQH